MINNIDFGRKRPCTGCFACSVVCPKSAIKISQDKNGFYKSTVNQDLCVECGLCKKVCYSFINFQKNQNQLKGYYGWHKDKEVLFHSASGGLTTAIATTFIEKGFSVVGCTYDVNSKKSKHIVIDDKKDINKILGSKYFQSDLQECVSFLKNDIGRNKKVVFFGTPCQILGFKEVIKLLKIDMSNVFLVELFCHGVVSQKVWEKYVDSKKFNQLKNVRFRTKHFGWHISCNEFELSNKTISTDRLGDTFFRAFYSKAFFNLSCYDCQARKDLTNADLRIGDFWGSRFVSNRKGVSCAISSNEKGEYILHEIQKDFEIFSVDVNEILKGQSYNQKYPFNQEQWDKLYDVLNKKTLNKAIYCSNKDKPLVERVKNWLNIKLSNLKNKLHL